MKRLTDSDRAKLLSVFLKSQTLENISPLSDDDGNTQDALFSYRGCDVCKEGAADVYECDGYSKKQKAVLSGYEVCHACLCVEANGINDGSDK